MLCKVTLHLCKTRFEPINKLFGPERLVKASGLDRRNTDLRKKSQEAHFISIVTTIIRKGAQNR
jgi:hypothetical protein